MIIRSTLVSLTLAVSGGSLWAWSAQQLDTKGRFESHPNPLGIQRSPYGQVIAMAFQAPVDKDWHGGIEIHEHDHDHAPDPDHDHDHEEAHSDHHDDGHDHDHDHDHEEAHSDDHDHEGDSAGTTPESLPFLERLERAVSHRNNPRAPTAAHQFYIRQQIEKKLRFAYNLDPSHYANYASYHLFLKESSLGTSTLKGPQKIRHMVALAENTIRYGLNDNTGDPRPALTASAAAYNVLELMIEDEPDSYTAADFDRPLTVLNFCLKRHLDLLELSRQSGLWDLLSSARQEEILQRGNLGLKLRDSALATLNRRYPDHEFPAPR
ncbi:hypothetical protein HNR46_002608 [Haloferula luteola]|uniref:Uncharacterized protein n=1 Tax=Haloferula luteola TaxID=595692 RepID=A0A840V495_9BACT|nr:hypothetical protein [Haloferula luteola]MBB5352363.1 hypothetical protein [Haloferula luteola]